MTKKKEKRAFIEFSWVEVFVYVGILFLLFMILFNLIQNKKECKEEGMLVCSSYQKGCIDLGEEDCGFLCSNHYFLCNGTKVVSKCTGFEEINKKEYSLIKYGRSYGTFCKN